MRAMKRIGIAAMLLCTSSTVLGQESAPKKIVPVEAAGPVFDRPEAHHDGAVSYVEALASSDGRFKAGLYRTGAGELVVEAYPEDEFCYILSGTAKLISADGTTLDLGPGDTAFIPKGWKGRWLTPGFSKYFALYTGAPKIAAE